MPTKPKSSSSDDAPEAEATEDAKSTISKQKEEALSLFDEKPKKRKRASVKKKAAAAAAAAKEPKEAVKTVEDSKKEALSIFEEVEKKSASKGKKKILDDKEIEKKTSGEILPPISLLKADEKAAKEKKLRPAAKATATAKAKATATAKAAAKESASADGEVADTDVVATDVSAADDAEGVTEGNVIHIKPPIVVKDLAERMGLKPFMIIKDLIELDVFANPNQSLEPDVAATVCEKHGFVFEKEKREKGGGVHKVEEVIEEPAPPEEEVEEELQLRAPIVTFMGHVDHGKTSLLDAIRKTKITTGEAGGITQHIGAYSVEHGGKRVTFLDTPGHAAFTGMRARGAHVTDIVVIIIAADDGIMPQTIEAINHAKAADVKIMVAINKIDLEGANLDRVKAQLQEHDLAPEEWGGTTSVMEVSAIKGTGIDDMLELMLLEAEVLELRANPKSIARASVIEARIEPGKGPTATVIVQTGTLKVGTPFICGPFSGKVKLLLDDQGSAIKEAGPAMPAEVLGFSGVPHVGDEVVEMESERAAKKLGGERVEEARRAKLTKPGRTSLEHLLSGGDVLPKLRLVIKTDVQGSIEAIQKSLDEIESTKVTVDFLHSAPGAVTESDVILASASDAVVIGFNTKVENKAIKAAKSEGVQIKLYSIIYELIDQVKEAMLGLLEPEHRETVIGHAEVKQVFKLSKGRVAGCMVVDGRVTRSARARVVRDGQPVYDGGLHTLRRFQDEVSEVRNGLECGIKLGDFNEYEVGDTIECYELEKLDQTL